MSEEWKGSQYNEAHRNKEKKGRKLGQSNSQG